MGDISYKPLIEDMTFSYSRINSYNTCPYGWFLNYIDCLKKGSKFYSSYGSLMHKILEKYFNNNISKSDMPVEFLSRFSTDVKGDRPSPKVVDNYIHNSIEFLNNFDGFPDLNIISVEEKSKFNIGGINMVGVIDIVAEKDGEYYIIDHKSHELKPRSNRKKPTIKDKELDEYLRQLYLYSTIIKDKYGKFPKELWFNCYRNGLIVKEEFHLQKYEEACSWAVETVNNIMKDTDFDTRYDYFYCRYICDQSSNCELYDQVNEF